MEVRDQIHVLAVLTAGWRLVWYQSRSGRNEQRNLNAPTGT
jgi:hypothetical protein